MEITMENSAKKPFNKRAFISIAMFISFMGLPFSGLINHYNQFDIMSTERHFWMAFHNMSATLFCIFALFHLRYNWNVLINYTKKLKTIKISKEFAVAFALVVFLVSVFSSHAFHLGR